MWFSRGPTAAAVLSGGLGGHSLALFARAPFEKPNGFCFSMDVLAFVEKLSVAQSARAFFERLSGSRKVQRLLSRPGCLGLRSLA